MQHANRCARATAVIVIAAAALFTVPIGAAPAFAATSPNLVKNGTAEKGTAGPGGAVVPVPNWTESQGASFTVASYAEGGGFPVATDPGPKRRGKNFFSGGASDPSNTIIASQTVSLKAYAAAIVSGTAGFKLDGYLGGYATQDDSGIVEVDFNDKHGTTLAAPTIGPVNAVDRGNVTGLIELSTKGRVPIGAKTAVVHLEFIRTAGDYNDGCADNVSLTLSGV